METTIDLSTAFTLKEVLDFADDADERRAAGAARTPASPQRDSAPPPAHDRENWARTNKAAATAGGREMAATVLKAPRMPRRRLQPTPRRVGAVAAACATRRAVDDVPVFSFALS
jgi:hypothetical protein